MNRPGLVLDPDFCVVGSGAGGSIAAATLAAGGARVAILEEGGHHTRRDFNMQEAWAYPALYQEHGNRATDDLSIIILQGRSVGGGTTVNWTSSFRPPERTLALWSSRHGVRDLDAAALAPHLEAVEQRLGVGTGSKDDVNRNNRKLWDGAHTLGWKPELIRRSVRGCARLGYCGMGCPLDAKQSALVSYVPDATAAGATLHARTRAVRLEPDGTGRRIVTVHADTLDEATGQPTGPPVLVRPRRGVVLAGGAINTPALLLRSRVGNRSGRVGLRTFLHVTVPTLAFFRETIEAYYGAPQSVSCHHFADRGDRVGYLFETPPIHPMLAALALPNFGADHRRMAERLPHAQSVIALLVDGHHDDQGGTVSCSDDGRIKLRYPIAPALWEAARDAMKNAARLQLAAGAEEVWTLHAEPIRIRGEADLARVDAAPLGPNRMTLFSAHQMGGCAMGGDRATSVVDSLGRHHEIENLWIADGSIFPTSLGVNPQITIYAVARHIAQQILTRS